jgi:microcin C transport system permease protein
MALAEDTPPARPRIAPSRGCGRAPCCPPPRRGWLSPLNQRRWRNFKAQPARLLVADHLRVLFGLSLFAEFIANDKPILVQYEGGYYTPIFNFYPRRSSAAISAPRRSIATSRCSA